MLSSNTLPTYIFFIFKKIKDMIFKKSHWNFINTYRLQTLSLIVLYSYNLSNLPNKKLPIDLKNKLLISRRNRIFYRFVLVFIILYFLIKIKLLLTPNRLNQTIKTDIFYLDSISYSWDNEYISLEMNEK